MRTVVICLLCVLLPAGLAEAGEAKNVILMIADGAGFHCFHCASYYQHGKLGKQVYDAFPVKLACSTYPRIPRDPCGDLAKVDPVRKIGTRRFRAYCSVENMDSECNMGFQPMRKPAMFFTFDSFLHGLEAPVFAVFFEKTSGTGVF